MEFFDKLGKKASEAYKVTADKTGKIAKDTKIKLKISDLKSKINNLYNEIGKNVYEKHTSNEEVAGVEKEIEEKCLKIDEISSKIESLLKESLKLRDKKQCPSCYTEMEKNVKFCPNCGEKQEMPEEPIVVEDEESKEKDVIEAEIIEENNQENIQEKDEKTEPEVEVVEKEEESKEDEVN